MKKRFIIAPVGAAAVGAAVLYLYRKTQASKAATGKKTPAASGAVVKNAKSAAYSFASGYHDSKTVEVKFNFDAELFSFAVVSEGFISDTGDSHVGLLQGPDFAAQVEYAAYFGDEDFAAHSKNIQAAHSGCADICCNGINGIRYYHGRTLCLAFHAAGAPADYVLITIVPAKDSKDDEYLKLWDNGDLQAMLATLTIAAG